MSEFAHHRLQATTQAPHHARSLLTREIEGFSSLEEREVAELLISELVTNALRHTESDVIVVDVGINGRVRVGVTDVSPWMPQRRSPRTAEAEGRGLVIVEELAERWGIEPIAGNGKRVWFELPAHNTTA